MSTGFFSGAAHRAEPWEGRKPDCDGSLNAYKRLMAGGCKSAMRRWLPGVFMVMPCCV